MNQNFQLKLLLKQNSQMASKLQLYRKQNQHLSNQNENLNLWTQNLCEVLSAIGSAWKSIIGNEQSFYNLLTTNKNLPFMEGNNDTNPNLMLIHKYMSHFDTFDRIIDNLAEKITNEGYSEKQTYDAKKRINAFVNSYQWFFKELLQNYFQFNEQYMRWVEELSSKCDINENFRAIANKEIENRLKIRQFESFMVSHLKKQKQFETQNQHKLMDGLFEEKNKQIRFLEEKNSTLSRRIALMTDYRSKEGGDKQLRISEISQKDLICQCGASQLQYYNTTWEKHIQSIRALEESNLNQLKTQNEGQLTHAKKQHIQTLQHEKQIFEERAAHLSAKIQTMKIQNKLSEDMVMSSSAFATLQGQCQELIDFVNQLLVKISTHQAYLFEIETLREAEIVELRKKYIEKGNNTSSLDRQKSEGMQIQPSAEQFKPQTNFIEFKSSVTELIQNLTKQYVEIKGKLSPKSEYTQKNKEYQETLKKQNESLNRKLEDLEKKGSMSLQFRHEKFKELQHSINTLLKDTNQKQDLVALWKDFIQYIKSRDKKINYLQGTIKKKEKEVLQKDKFLGVLQASLTQTQTVCLSIQEQLNKFTDFTNKVQKELIKLAEQNLSQKAQFEQQKTMMTYKNKADLQARSVLQEKVKSYETIEEQINEVRKSTLEATVSYEAWIKEQQQKLMQVVMEKQEGIIREAQLKAHIEEQNKCIKKVVADKEKGREQYEMLLRKMEYLQKQAESELLKIQLQAYRKKVMCSCCNGQRQISVALSTCPHVFCKKCITDSSMSRSRKCPLCGIKFSKQDTHDIVLS